MVGGVAVIAIICSVAYIIVRRKRNKQREVVYSQRAMEEIPTSISYSELHSRPQRAEHAGSPYSELHGRPQRAEHAGSQLHEMEGRREELP